MKYALLLFILITFSGCSLFRKGRSTEPVTGRSNTDYNVVIGNVLANNITGKGFEIRKGSIELEGTEIEGKFGLNARLNSKGDFYASVRGPLGIELVRLLMVGNDVAAIDRFNKTVYVGKKDAVLKKYGMPDDIMKIIFGDMPEENNGNYRFTEEHIVSLTSGDTDFIREILICVEEMKVCSEKISAMDSGHEIYITFGNFSGVDGIRYPKVVELSERIKMFHVKLTIDDLIPGYDSDIVFNIPSYRKEAL